MLPGTLTCTVNVTNLLLRWYAGNKYAQRLNRKEP